MEVLGLFLHWKDYGTKGAEFVSIGWWSTKPKDLIKNCKNTNFKIYRERIISNAEGRVRPINYEILEDHEKECLTILKNKLHEYQNN